MSTAHEDLVVDDDDQHYDEAGDVVRASQERSHRLHSGVLIHHLQVGGCNLGIF